MTGCQSLKLGLLLYCFDGWGLAWLRHGLQDYSRGWTLTPVSCARLALMPSFFLAMALDVILWLNSSEAA